MKVKLDVAGDLHDITFEETDGGWVAKLGDATWPVEAANGIIRVDGQAFSIGRHDRDAVLVDGHPVSYRIHELHGMAGADETGGGGHGPIHAPMTGRLEEVLVTAGQEVAAGDVLFVLEAMKMRNQIKAQAPGVVASIHADIGATVDPKTVILTLDPQ